MKKEVVLFLSLVSILPFISAQFLGGFSPADLLSAIDAQTIFILIIFGLLGLLFKKSLETFGVFRGTTGGIISVLASALATLGINKGVNINDIFSGFGFSGNLLPYLLVGLLVVFIFFLFKYGWKTWLIFGLLLIAIALFTDLVYEKGTVLVIGIVIIGIWLLKAIWRFIFGKNNVRGPLGQGAKLAGTGIGKTGFWFGKKMIENQKAYEKYQYSNMQEQAMRMNKRLDQISERMKQIVREMNYVREKMMVLQKQIPYVSVIERGKIEDELKKLSKLGGRLQDEYSSLTKEYKKIRG